MVLITPIWILLDLWAAFKRGYSVVAERRAIR